MKTVLQIQTLNSLFHIYIKQESDTTDRTQYSFHLVVLLPVATSRWRSNWPPALLSGQCCQHCHLTVCWGAEFEFPSSVSALPHSDEGWCSAAPTGTTERLTHPSQLEREKRERGIIFDGFILFYFILFFIKILFWYSVFIVQRWNWLKLMNIIFH